MNSLQSTPVADCSSRVVFDPWEETLEAVFLTLLGQRLANIERLGNDLLDEVLDLDTTSRDCRSAC
jgi:hypothetical protein